ncbi:DUF551 domain-containing protein [Chishuiella changwenlii]|uniref:DUF551 domain-containing protein n=1 Tax=Chishuiella changwenlii TaxID=1434701 RepID=UPI002FD94DBD
MKKEIEPAIDLVKEAKIIIAKQEVIKEAWGLNYNKFSEHIDSDGWLDTAWLDDSEIHYDVKDGYDECGTESTFIRPKSLQGIETNNGWIKIEDQLPEESIEVLFFNEKWINEDYNPFGTRIGFYNNEDFITAYYWNYQDTYITISHNECDDDDGFSDEIKNSIEPTHWKYVNDKPPIY